MSNSRDVGESFRPVLDQTAEESADIPGVCSADQASIGSRRSLLDGIKTKNMALSIPVFLVGLLRPTTLNVLMQYTSIYFDWKLSQSAMFISEVAAVNLIMFLVVVPQSMKILQSKYHLGQQTMDLSLLRGSMICLSIGALCLGLARNISSIIAGD